MDECSAVLTYHSIDTSGSVISTPPDLFERQMELLAHSGIPVVPLERVTHGQPTVALTFDDGYANFASTALPALSRHGFPSTVFVVTGTCGKTTDWMRPPFPVLPLMSWDELRALPADLVSIGAHGSTHRDLTSMTEAAAADEILSSKSLLEHRIERTVPCFAYPYGASNSRVRDLVRSRFQLACGMSLRFLDEDDDRFDLPRIDVYYLRDLRRFRDFTAGRARRYLQFHRFLRELRRRWGPCP